MFGKPKVRCDLCQSVVTFYDASWPDKDLELATVMETITKSCASARASHALDSEGEIALARVVRDTLNNVDRETNSGSTDVVSDATWGKTTLCEAHRLTGLSPDCFMLAAATAYHWTALEQINVARPFQTVQEIVQFFASYNIHPYLAVLGARNSGLSQKTIRSLSTIKPMEVLATSRRLTASQFMMWIHPIRFQDPAFWNGRQAEMSEKVHEALIDTPARHQNVQQQKREQGVGQRIKKHFARYRLKPTRLPHPTGYEDFPATKRSRYARL